MSLLIKNLKPSHIIKRFLSSEQPQQAPHEAQQGSGQEVVLDIKEYKVHKLQSTPAMQAKVTREEALKYFKEMTIIRRIENAASNLYKEKLIRGFLHLYNGQEACAVGMFNVMEKNDRVISAYRCHGWAYLMGVKEYPMLAELMGLETGAHRGKGGSMHIYAKNFYGGNGIVGAQVPVGNGIAFALKYTDQKNVCFALYGDGAANQGQIAESFNIAKLWNLPTIFVIENNLYGMGTRADRAAFSTAYYTRGDYVPGVWVDGMDVVAVREATRFCCEHCKTGKGPILMELATYRYHGHSMSDPGTTYRTRQEVEGVRKSRDPITSFREKIVNAGLVTAEEFKAIDDAALKLVKEAVEKARKDKMPQEKELYYDIYAGENPPMTIRGKNHWRVEKNVRVGKCENLK